VSGTAADIEESNLGIAILDRREIQEFHEIAPDIGFRAGGELSSIVARPDFEEKPLERVAKVLC
jgi:hypothetical protein